MWNFHSFLFLGYVLNGITLVAEIAKDSDKTKK